MQINQALSRATQILRARGVTEPVLDSAVILAAVLGMPRENMYIEAGKEIGPDRLSLFWGMLERRAGGEPVQYITGNREFMSLDFIVKPGVLIPRPETEFLVEKVMEISACMAREATAGLTIVDIGTGSGAIAVSLAVLLSPRIPGLRLVATDISTDALCVAQANARKHQADGIVEFVQGNLWEAADQLGLRGMIDIVASNPPYIPAGEIAGLQREVRHFEPTLALNGGEDGLSFYRRLCDEARGYLRRGGALVVEVGVGQAQCVAELIDAGGLLASGVEKDLAGIDRVVWGYAPYS